MRRRERGNRQGHYERAGQRHLILPFSYSNQDLFCGRGANASPRFNEEARRNDMTISQSGDDAACAVYTEWNQGGARTGAHRHANFGRGDLALARGRRLAERFWLCGRAAAEAERKRAAAISGSGSD